MNKYTGLSDFKINRRIAVMIHKYSNIIESQDNKTIYVDGNVFDPCNNPTDAMPIIIEYEITIAFTQNGVIQARKNGITSTYNKDKYCRATMEVYLLMKDAENEKV